MAVDDHPLLSKQDIVKLVERTDKDENRRNQATIEDTVGDVLVKPSAQKKEARQNLAVDYLDGEIRFPAEALQASMHTCTIGLISDRGGNCENYWEISEVHHSRQASYWVSRTVFEQSESFIPSILPPLGLS